MSIQSRPQPDNSHCKQEAGTIVPVINRNRCDGKTVCVDACPQSVLGMHILPEAQRRGLNAIGKIKGFVHRWHQVELVNPDACVACGDCVAICPEKAITLIKTSP